MATYISLLRAGNVGGKNIIKMNELKTSFEAAGFSNISTYLQSGNIVFTYQDTSCLELANKIAERIKADFGLSLFVVVLAGEDLQQLIDRNPFSSTQLDASHLYVTILSKQATSQHITYFEEKLQATDQLAAEGNVIYLYCASGYGRTKLSNNFLEEKVQAKATTRSWKTILNLLKIALKRT